MKPNNILSLLPVATVILFFSSLLPGTASQASDLEREQRLADEIVEAILDGEPVTLQADGHDFLGIHTPAESDPGPGAAVILHGRGMHPDWAQVAHPLRVGLPAHGWSTLSIQMPVLGKEAKYHDYESIFPEATPRIETAIAYLKHRDPAASP